MKALRNFLFSSIAVGIASLQVLQADGPAHDQITKRYTGGPKLVFTLTEEQLEFLERKKKTNEPRDFVDSLLPLTPQQRKIIREQWGIVVSKVDVWETRFDAWDCSCHAANAAFRFAENKIEIGKAFATTDKFALQVWNGKASLPFPKK